MKNKGIKKKGTILEALPNLTFKVKFDDDNKEALVYLAGKLRIFRIKILPGDKVTIELSPYDETRGRIIWREK